MKHMFAFASVLASFAAVAMPSIEKDSVTVSQDASRKVTVSYRLKSEKAIVTIDIQTNCTGTASGPWASIGPGNLTHMVGAVNRLVTDTEGTSQAYWRPDKSWPDGGRVENARAVVTAWATNCPPDYMVLDLATKDVAFYVDAAQVPDGVSARPYKTTKLVMRKIPASNVIWNMGSPSTETGRTERNFETLHPVSLSEDYYVSIYELTQGQWKNMGFTIPSACPWTTLDDADLRPVTNVKLTDLRIGSTYNPATYTYKLKGHTVSSGCKIDTLRNTYGIGFDIPTSAEWEFACRAGCAEPFHDGTTSIENVGWNVDNSKVEDVCTPHVVGTKQANAWGLYDMHGNVQEWVCEYCASVDNVWKEGDPTVIDPANGNEKGQYMMSRGGRANSPVASCRAAMADNGSMSAADNQTDVSLFNGVRLTARAVYAK